MVSLGQKLKMPKIWKKPFYNTIGVFLLKKKKARKTKYSRIETIFFLVVRAALDFVSVVYCIDTDEISMERTTFFFIYF